MNDYNMQDLMNDMLVFSGSTPQVQNSGDYAPIKRLEVMPIPFRISRETLNGDYWVPNPLFLIVSMN